ncbi:hypothetical protein CRG98_005453 [Punica granatum]|uniref:RWD domain-containing protein n=1 Tax=Punica granatum TaxID=22663 RepID=A0A2I0L0G7_PUNGR|nr:hypothetical protein CRG98_005453 [Punica granatum]
MGQGSKKKKKGVKRSKGRSASKDKASQSDGDNDLLSEEITALCAIFQEDCKIVSESPPRMIIKLRPYSKDMGFEDVDVSALLSVRCLPGYPHKCPKLQITPEKGLSKADADNLLSLLNDQKIERKEGSGSPIGGPNPNRPRTSSRRSLVDSGWRPQLATPTRGRRPQQ